MEPDDICAVLNDLGIEHFVDCCNPDYTIHITRTGDLIDRCMLESDWHFISLDRSAYITLNNADDLKTVMAQRTGVNHGI